MDRIIDIIIPIYNAYEDLVKCVQSVREYTEIGKYRLILINDNSTDNRVKEFLDKISGNDIIVFHNETNQGFSSNINKGMKCSENDVILLNSDTIVTERWLNKIEECAYSYDRIGTVTPLSNSATLASIPVFGHDNKLPKNLSIKQISEVVEKYSLKKYPQIPVAVGFCMYIKREVIAKIGYFDAKTFGKGYGEENDFCYRAELAGYIHVLCDDTFIYHKGTASFLSDEKQKLIEKHTEVLEERYECFMKATHEFCIQNPQQYIRDNFNFWMNFYNQKKNVLLVLHEDFEKGILGGTQLHVKNLIDGLQDDVNFFLVSKDKNKLKIVSYVENEKNIFIKNLEDIENCPSLFKRELKILFSEILDIFRIDLVHVHHLQGLSLDIFYEAHKRNIPILTTIHDFWFLCPTIFLTNLMGNVCEIYQGELCDECLKKSLGFQNKSCYIERWQEECHNALRLSSLIIAPSESARKQVLNYYADLDSKIKVVEHGVEKNIKEKNEPFVVQKSDKIRFYIEKNTLEMENGSLISGWAFLEDVDNSNLKIFVRILDNDYHEEHYLVEKENRMDVDEYFEGNGKYVYSGFKVNIHKYKLKPGKAKISILIGLNSIWYETDQEEIFIRKKKRKENNKVIKVAFLGGLSKIKGAEFAYQMIKKSDPKKIEWYILGNIDPNEKLYSLEKENLYKLGRYERTDIQSIFDGYGIDMVCILSICSETYSYTLTEAIMCGRPVLALDRGAVGERLKKLDAGWIMPGNASYEDILERIENIRIEKEYLHKKGDLKQLGIKDVKKMIEEYREIYKILFRNDILHNKFSVKKWVKEL